MLTDKLHPWSAKIASHKGSEQHRICDRETVDYRDNSERERSNYTLLWEAWICVRVVCETWDHHHSDTPSQRISDSIKYRTLIISGYRKSNILLWTTRPTLQSTQESSIPKTPSSTDTIMYIRGRTNWCLVHGEIGGAVSTNNPPPLPYTTAQ